MDYSQLDYLTNVLGVSEILCDPSTLSSAQSRAQEAGRVADLQAGADSAKLRVEGNAQARVFFVLSEYLEAAEKALLHKMIRAMKLRPEDVLVVEGCEVDANWNMVTGFFEGAGKIVVSMASQNVASNRLGQSEEKEGNMVFYSYSPRDLEMDANLKKPAWGHLQNVMRYLK